MAVLADGHVVFDADADSFPAIVDRRLAYEKDRADPVFADETHAFDRKLLERFPIGYRFLAYAQTKRGLDVYRDLPGLRGPEVEALYARGKAWLAGI